MYTWARGDWRGARQTPRGGLSSSFLEVEAASTVGGERNYWMSPDRVVTSKFNLRGVMRGRELSGEQEPGRAAAHLTLFPALRAPGRRAPGSW